MFDIGYEYFIPFTKNQLQNTRSLYHQMLAEDLCGRGKWKREDTVWLLLFLICLDHKKLRLTFGVLLLVFSQRLISRKGHLTFSSCTNILFPEVLEVNRHIPTPWLTRISLSNTTFQKIPISHLTRAMKQKFLH